MASWYWLSFVDVHGPPGKQFLGVIVAGPAPSAPDAIALTHALGINPGGETVGFQFPDGELEAVPVAMRNRLLTLPEAECIGGMRAHDIHIRRRR